MLAGTYVLHDLVVQIAPRDDHLLDIAQQTAVIAGTRICIQVLESGRVFSASRQHLICLRANPFGGGQVTHMHRDLRQTRSDFHRKFQFVGVPGRLRGGLIGTGQRPERQPGKACDLEDDGRRGDRHLLIDSDVRQSGHRHSPPAIRPLYSCTCPRGTPIWSQNMPPLGLFRTSVSF